MPGSEDRTTDGMADFPTYDFLFNYDGTALAEDRATLGSDPSADPGAKTEAGCRKMPRLV